MAYLDDFVGGEKHWNGTAPITGFVVAGFIGLNLLMMMFPLLAVVVALLLTAILHPVIEVGMEYGGYAIVAGCVFGCIICAVLALFLAERGEGKASTLLWSCAVAVVGIPITYLHTVYSAISAFS